MEINRQLLKSRSGEFDIESIHTIDLSKLDICDLGCVGECSTLQRLNLSCNDVTRLYALASLMNLQVLNLSGNRIQSLEGLQALDNLCSLNLAGNLIGSAQMLRVISGLEQLRSLRLQNRLAGISNPLCASDTYRQDVLEVLPNLIELDGEVLKGPGCEVFKKLLELERSFDSDDKTFGNSKSEEQKICLPSEDLELLTASLKLETHENELSDMLEECQRLSLELDNKLHPTQVSRNTVS